MSDPKLPLEPVESSTPITAGQGPSSQSKSWTKQDYLLCTLAVLIKFGDGVEGYLPGVITQKASCELGVSDFQEGILAMILYLFWTISIGISGFILNKFGEKFTILLSLYLSIVFAILCAAVPNYYTLLLSRALTGMCMGLNGCSTLLFVKRLVSSKDVFIQITFIAENIAYAAGGIWVSVLGWLFLKLVNWRVFVLITSIPLFIPPIVILHFCINDNSEDEKEEDEENSNEDKNNVKSETDVLLDAESKRVPNLTERIIKSSFFFFSNSFVGYGSIILVPWLIRIHKRDVLGVDNGVGKCEEEVQGNDLLILAAVSGGANFIGRFIGIFLWSRFRFLTLQLTTTAVMALSYGIVMAKPGLIIGVVFLGLAKVCFSIQKVEISILLYDCEYFGRSRLWLASTIGNVAELSGAVVGTSFAAFFDPYTTVLVTLVIACIEFIDICLMKERF